MPSTLDFLPDHFIIKKTIKYPDEQFLFYEKEPVSYIWTKGRYFVHKDMKVEFVPEGSSPQHQAEAINIIF